jgi:uncharacterized Zn finger protein (UPF0148 family)
MILQCPHCDTYLPEGAAGTCPSCNRSIVPQTPQDQQIAAPQTAQKLSTPRSEPNLSLDDGGPIDPLSATAAVRDVLLDRIRALENRVRDLETELEARTSHTSLTSPNFLTRAFAVFGHWFVA